jgi:hypothetical protein
MSRQPEDKTAKQEMTSLIKWADTQGFSNIAEALRRVLPFVRDERDYQRKAKH